MAVIDRRSLLAVTAGAVAASVIPSLPSPNFLSPVMAARLRDMRDALAVLKAANEPLQDDVIHHARDCVERAFATACVSVDDEDAVMIALDAYEDIHPSAFAMQTARDLFTPRRHQTYPLDRLRHWLLTDPDEDFAKTGMPGFLQEMRTRYRLLHEPSA